MIGRHNFPTAEHSWFKIKRNVCVQWLVVAGVSASPGEASRIDLRSPASLVGIVLRPRAT